MGREREQKGENACSSARACGPLWGASSPGPAASASASAASEAAARRACAEAAASSKCFSAASPAAFTRRSASVCERPAASRTAWWAAAASERATEVALRASASNELLLLASSSVRSCGRGGARNGSVRGACVESAWETHALPDVRLCGHRGDARGVANSAAATRRARVGDTALQERFAFDATRLYVVRHTQCQNTDLASLCDQHLQACWRQERFSLCPGPRAPRCGAYAPPLLLPAHPSSLRRWMRWAALRPPGRPSTPRWSRRWRLRLGAATQAA